MSLVNRGRFSVLKRQMVTNKLLFLFNALTFYSTNSFSDEVGRKFSLNFYKSPISKGQKKKFVIMVGRESSLEFQFMSGGSLKRADVGGNLKNPPPFENLHFDPLPPL